MFVYKVKNAINDKVYVGITTKTISDRFYKHKQESRAGSDCAIHRAIRKYGEDNFMVEQIDEAKDKQELLEKEIFWIEELNSFECGYNLTAGGEGSFKRKWTDEQIQEASDRQSKLMENPELREKIRDGVLNSGFVHTDEHREKIVKSLLGNQRAKGNTYNHTEEAKRKISIAKKGEKHPWSEGSKNINAKKCNIYMEDGRILEFETVTEASKTLNIPLPTMKWSVKHNIPSKKHGYLKIEKVSINGN